MKPEIAKKIVQKTIADYSQIAADFDRTRSKYAWPILREFAEYVKMGDIVLDFGCGNGRLLDALKAENIVYKGVDPVKELIDIARQKYQRGSTLNLQKGRTSSYSSEIEPPIEFRTIDFDAENFKLYFPDKYFDKIFAIAVFHHIPSDKLRRDVLKELKRVLRNDGRIFLTVWNIWRWKYLFNILKFFLMKIFGRIDIDYGDLFITYTTADRKITIQRYHHAFTKREMRKLAESAGLKIERIFYDENKYNLCAILRK